jgi:hypothetical protein
MKAQNPLASMLTALVSAVRATLEIGMPPAGVSASDFNHLDRKYSDDRRSALGRIGVATWVPLQQLTR